MLWQHPTWLHGIGTHHLQQKAFDLLTSGRTRDAFDLEREPAPLRDAYGQNLWGQSMLTARRLVEAGVVFVTVTWEVFESPPKFGNGIAFDTHDNNFDALKRELLPALDQGYAALVRDLQDRGRLGETLVIVMGEMGRSPRVNRAAGRDHWPQCGFCLFAGGGTRPGVVHGTTDKIAAFPDSNPVSAGELVATVYELVGVDPEGAVPDHTGRPQYIAHGGSPVRAIMR